MDRHDPHLLRREFADGFERLRRDYDLDTVVHQLAHASRAATDRYYRRR
ncbi:hypothetical protein [Sphingomonas sp. TF3]|nr:hypothetical protein [Sphingomonas sp. TF3]